MHSGLSKLLTAQKILLQIEKTPFVEIRISEDGRELRAILRNGISLFIVYNNHDEYSYTIQFSADPIDRVRYDNFDDRWLVTSKPHHCHPRGEKDAISSPMTGNPEYDIPKLLSKSSRNQ